MFLFVTQLTRKTWHIFIDGAAESSKNNNNKWELQKKAPNKTLRLEAVWGYGNFLFLFTFHKMTHAFFCSKLDSNYSETKRMFEGCVSQLSIKISITVGGQVDCGRSQAVSVSGLCFWQ